MSVATAQQFETVIGLEVHAQVLTNSKMYCGCSADYANAEPNTHTCPVCLGLPGAMPVMNRAGIEGAMLTGIALNCEIPPYCKLDRKNYGYPDLPKAPERGSIEACLDKAVDLLLDRIAVRGVGFHGGCQKLRLETAEIRRISGSSSQDLDVGRSPPTKGFSREVGRAETILVVKPVEFRV